MTAEELTTGTVVAIGDPARLAGYAVAGAEVLPARTVAQAITAWEALQDGVGLALLTAEAAHALGARVGRPGAPLTAVIPG
jgi:vacuolar-type H+-ATPase subunit F/Vma7